MLEDDPSEICCYGSDIRKNTSPWFVTPLIGPQQCGNVISSEESTFELLGKLQRPQEAMGKAKTVFDSTFFFFLIGAKNSHYNKELILFRDSNLSPRIFQLAKKSGIVRSSMVWLATLTFVGVRIPTSGAFTPGPIQAQCDHQSRDPRYPREKLIYVLVDRLELVSALNFIEMRIPTYGLFAPGSIQS